MNWSAFLVSHIRLRTLTALEAATKSNMASKKLASTVIKSPRTAVNLNMTVFNPVRSLSLLANPLLQEFRPENRLPRGNDRVPPTGSGELENPPEEMGSPRSELDPTMRAAEASKHGKYRPQEVDGKGQPPDANEMQDTLADDKRAEKKNDFEYIRSQCDKANYQAPKRLSSFKDVIKDDLKHAKQSFESARDAVKETISELPDKAKELEHKIEEKGAKLTDKVKKFIHRK